MTAMAGDILDAANLSYEEAKLLAQDADPEIRAALAQRTDIQPELLYFLAEDKSADVRKAIASNEHTPCQADLKLASDADDSVRTGLVGKIAKLAPGLSASDRDRVRKTTHQTLEILARDQVTRVRQVLAETLKDVADAPTDIIKTLASDTEIAVAGPVLENSPVLTDEDLISIIESSPVQGAVGAIARRDGVSENVADAVAGTDDVDAIADLLGNSSAQIREETLDDLVERADNVALWHAPLVGRPKLSAKAAERLAGMVADNLLSVLEQRTDLDHDTLDAVKTMVHRRLSGAEKERASGGMDVFQVEPPITVAERLHAAGRLDPKVVAKALHASDHAFVLAAIAVRGEIDVKTVQTIFAEGSPKGVAAACWRAGLPIKLAVLAQTRMARIPQAEVVEPDAKGDYPLNEDEMTWQLEFFGDLAAKN